MSAKIADRGSPQIITVSDFVSLADIAYTTTAIAPALFCFFNELEGGDLGQMRGDIRWCCSRRMTGLRTETFVAVCGSDYKGRKEPITQYSLVETG